VTIPATAPATAPATQTGGQVRSARSLSTPAIFTFFTLTFGWTWGLWAISSLIQSQAPGLRTGLFLASAFGPSFAAVAVIVVFDGIVGLRRWLGQCFRWRVGGRWYAVALLTPPLIMLAALGIYAALGGAILTSPVAGHIVMAIAQFPMIMLLGGPLGEEFGWRGFALPALTAKMGWRVASLVIGVVWGAWHVPLFFMAGTAQADLPMALFLASTVALSVVFARLSVNTRFSVIPAILLHSAINWWSMVLPVMPRDGNAQAYSLVMVIVIAIALAAFLMPGPKKAPSC
jgi:uncharacterized protein